MVKNRDNQYEIHRLIRQRDLLSVKYDKSVVWKQPFGKADSPPIKIDSAIMLSLTYATVRPGSAAKIKNHFIFQGETVSNMVVNIFFGKPSGAYDGVIQSRGQIHKAVHTYLFKFDGLRKIVSEPKPNYECQKFLRPDANTTVKKGTGGSTAAVPVPDFAGLVGIYDCLW